MANFDKFYTKKDTAKMCVDILNDLLDVEDELFLEPSAGDGSFLEFLKNYEAYDIMPEDERIIQKDFLTFESQKKNYITIGNPPFGKRSKLAIDFFNKCSEVSEVVAFIVPISFMKYGVQSKLSPEFKLLFVGKIGESSFLDREKDFDVNCVFQIWVKENSKYDKGTNLRIKERPKITSDDFTIHQYNATEKSYKVVDEDWDIALYRQGYHDYNKVFTQEDKEYLKRCMSGEETGKKQQFFFIKFGSKEVKDFLLSLNFNELAARNTSTPGFGKADFVSFYNDKNS